MTSLTWFFSAGGVFFFRKLINDDNRWLRKSIAPIGDHSLFFSFFFFFFKVEIFFSSLG